ncbi:MAG: hypothetical protein AUJ89_00905 [Candidatus Omnitrophica bacterium CG1_02_43_210]|nr:MAG: hypothetical protein AUJ89_00905 [Candidatus Omnitrophica bacterium CG1_02_43_210]PIR66190.1 MAG: hypothetical protein COU52_00205 [Candidatus Omnitrophica bacterium CG10_big_fil_rev_8_21_14_0_10_43_8]PJC46605.1 MAG: hypothetical protein CO036_01950 [Candidatus Omnitrophica bacterium CG_4_9_14_0_2_um_filter_43_12]
MLNIKIKKISVLFAVLFLFSQFNAFCQDVDQSAAVTSENITLDIKGMDILDVLKILSMKSGLNIVAGKNVTGRVTIFLKDVNVWDALQIVLVANNLAYEKQGNIINVMTDRDYELIYGEKFYDKKRVYIAKLQYAKAADVSKVLMQAKTNVGKVIADEGSNTIVLMDVPASILQMKRMIDEMDEPTRTMIFSLQYAKAEDIEKNVSELVTKNLGYIKIDARTNKIAVTDVPQQLEKIEKLINAFDQKDAQVMIEAKILEVTLSDNFKMGIDWDVIADKYFRLTQNLKLGLTSGGTVKIGTIAGGGSPTDEGDYSSLIDALREVGDVNTLSAPKIMALNNQESKILVGTRQPYSTQSVVSSQQTTTTAESVTFVDLGVKLYVTPTINENGFITMKIKPEVSTKSGDYTTSDNNTIPIISTTEAETTIMVKDGATVVIAGLIKDTVDKSSKKVPFLGSIPVLGHLFSNISNEKRKEEIVVLLTPHIVTGESMFSETEKWRRHEALVDKIKDSVEIEDLKIKQARQKEELARQKSNLAEQKKELVGKKKQEKVEKKEPVVEVKKEEEPAVVSLIQKSNYSSYFLGIKNKIHDTAIKNFYDPDLRGECIIRFILDSKGNLFDEPVIVSEDSKLAGDVVLQSVKLASPFGDFPEEFGADKEEFTVAVSFQQ